jgi:hypothetical protein
MAKIPPSTHYALGGGGTCGTVKNQKKIKAKIPPSTYYALGGKSCAYVYLGVVAGESNKMTVLWGRPYYLTGDCT